MLIFLDLQGKTQKKNNSYINWDEVIVLMHYITWAIKSRIKNIGIMSPYSGQVKEIQRFI